MKRILIAALALVLMAGCSVNSTFVYKPAAPVAGGSKLPVKLAVLPFTDGTENFTERGGLGNQKVWIINLAKSGVSRTFTALTPDLWAKAFADDMAASGGFQSFRFVYSPSELTDDNFRIEGTVEKANHAVTPHGSNEFAIDLRALRQVDNRLVWEKKVTRVWKTPWDYGDGCWGGAQCLVDRLHAEKNKVMQSLFAEAGADLLATLSSLSGSRAGEDGLPPAASPASPAPESADKEIERILNGN